MFWSLCFIYFVFLTFLEENLDALSLTMVEENTSSLTDAFGGISAVQDEASSGADSGGESSDSDEKSLHAESDGEGSHDPRLDALLSNAMPNGSTIWTVFDLHEAVDAKNAHLTVMTFIYIFTIMYSLLDIFLLFIYS